MKKLLILILGDDYYRHRYGNDSRRGGGRGSRNRGRGRRGRGRD